MTTRISRISASSAARRRRAAGRRRGPGVPAARAAALAALGATVLAGCGGHHKLTLQRPPAATVPPTTVATTTTTTRPKPKPKPLQPLTGLPATSAAQVTNPAVIVKIDNIDAARPQTGPNQADIVYEELVEGGLTRLAAVFQSGYPTVVGPVRSGRLTDIGIADDYNHPVFAYSGTNGVFLPILRSQPFTDVDGDNHPGAFYRVSFAATPHNLYSNVATLAAISSTRTAPLPIFSYHAPGAPFTGAGVSPAQHVGITFPDARVAWDYNAATGLWQRTQNGTPDLDRSGQQMTANNVVIQFVPYVTSGLATGEGGPPAPIPEGILTGTGKAWFLSGGRIVGGTWSRPNLTTRTTFKDQAGAVIRLAPGRTWIELVPVGTAPQLVP